MCTTALHSAKAYAQGMSIPTYNTTLSFRGEKATCHILSTNAGSRRRRHSSDHCIVSVSAHRQPQYIPRNTNAKRIYKM